MLLTKTNWIASAIDIESIIFFSQALMNARIILVRMVVLVLIVLLDATRVSVPRATKEKHARGVGFSTEF